jgi:hypothetical protein
MVIVTRIILTLVALMVLSPFLSLCHWFFLGPSHWNLGCVVWVLAEGIGIPLVIAFVAGYIKKDKDIFWTIFVGTLFTGTVVFFMIIYT